MIVRRAGRVRGLPSSSNLRGPERRRAARSPRTPAASRSSRPCSTSCIAAAPVIALVIDAIQPTVSGVISSPPPATRSPNPPRYRSPPAFVAPATTPAAAPPRDPIAEERIDPCVHGHRRSSRQFRSSIRLYAQTAPFPSGPAGTLAPAGAGGPADARGGGTSRRHDGRERRGLRFRALSTRRKGSMPAGRLGWGLVGGGEDSQIGGTHRIGARVDGAFDFVAGALDADPARGRSFARRLGVPEERAYGTWRGDAGRRAEPPRPPRSRDRRHAQRHPFRDREGRSWRRAATCFARSR